jgi:hypothetical protein
MGVPAIEEDKGKGTREQGEQEEQGNKEDAGTRRHGDAGSKQQRSRGAGEQRKNKPTYLLRTWSTSAQKPPHSSLSPSPPPLVLKLVAGWPRVIFLRNRGDFGC